MSTDPRIEAAIEAVDDVAGGWPGGIGIDDFNGMVKAIATAAIAAIDKAATIAPTIEHFINERPGYIAAMEGTRSTDEQSDYWRWSGHAEARRQLAQTIGYTVPHKVGERTRLEETADE